MFQIILYWRHSMRSEQQEAILVKFQRNRHPINRKSLQKTMAWLHQSTSNSLDTLIAKLNQLALQNGDHQENLQHALQILSLKSKNLGSYDELLDDTRKRCIYPISPYERDADSWFCQRPKKDLFQFIAEDKLKNSQAYFKRITQNNKQVIKDTTMGIIYESFTHINQSCKPKLIIQNQVNQVSLNLPNDFVPTCLILPGCTYIGRGKNEGKELALTVSSLSLPLSVGEQKNTLMKQKFKQMCQNISAGKQQLGFKASDFVKYDCVYTPTGQPFKPTIIYGNVTINNRTAERLRRLIEGFPSGVSCVILLLSGQLQESIDLAVWLKCKVYLVPHISSQGPRLLPKLPFLKNHIPSAKILTNPARISIQGRQLILVNYPLIKTIYSHCLLKKGLQTMGQQQLTGKVADLIFSQGNVSISQQIYWRQADYFNITNDSIVVINDSVASMGWQKSKGKGGMATTGNFQRDGDFLLLMCHSKNIIQYCEQPAE